jgi:hypothetical protein
VPVYDPESMSIAARNVDKIVDAVAETKTKITGVTADKPFGTMEGSNGVSDTLGSFTTGMRSELDAASRLFGETSRALRDAAKLTAETEHAAEDSLTMRDPGNAQA